MKSGIVRAAASWILLRAHVRGFMFPPGKRNEALYTMDDPSSRLAAPGRGKLAGIGLASASVNERGVWID
jgi:hypothetical protein